MTDVVVVSLENWDEVWRRNQHLVAGLLWSGEVDRVLFIEPAADPLHSLRRHEPPRIGSGLRAIDDVTGVELGRLCAYQPTKWLPRKLDPKGDTRWGTQVRQAAKQLGMVNPVLWVNDPLGAELLDTGWGALYDITDDWLLADRPAAELARLRRSEADLFARCAEVVVCSPALERTKSQQRRVVLIPNAVNLEPYRTLQPRPPDLPAGPTALYLGTAHRDRVDIDLCVTTAEKLSHAGGHLVLVGPAPLPGGDLQRLETAGVYVLGPRASDNVPAYLQHADALLVPHVLTEFTASLDPIKAYEYRAARRPVVATPVPGFVNVSDSLVSAVGPDSFPDAVAAAVAARVPWSHDVPDDIPTWSLRVDQMAAVLIRVRQASQGQT